MYHGAEAAAGTHRLPPPAAQAPAPPFRAASPLFAGFKSHVGLVRWFSEQDIGVLPGLRRALAANCSTRILGCPCSREGV